MPSEMLLNSIAQTTSGGGLGRIPDKTEHVWMHLVVETTHVSCTPPIVLNK